jgi:putative transposase
LTKAKEKYPDIRIRLLCKSLGLSKTAYYCLPSAMEERDLEDLALIKKYFDRSKQKDGIRQLAMIIEREEGLNLNHKRIARIKQKFGLETKIRVKNKYRQFAKNKIEHETCPNILERNFKNLRADQVYSTDITTLKYCGKKAYFAAVKDLETREIVGLSVSSRIDLELTNRAMDQALMKLCPKKRSELMVHSDQGFHFTHISFRSYLEKNGVLQSMSRKGNCLDNAPIESFFGLFKDHLDLRGCKTINEVEKEVTKIVDYYNDVRPQAGLKKMPPSEYRRHFY